MDTSSDKDEFDFDKFNFKPLSSGLGFHQDNSEKRQEFRPTTPLQRPFTPLQKTTASVKNDASPSHFQLPKDHTPLGVSQKNLRTENVTTEVNDVNKIIEASSIRVAAAFLVDSIILLSLQAVTFLIFALILKETFQLTFVQIQAIGIRTVFSQAVWICIIFFSLYFILLEGLLGTTPGKYIFGLWVEYQDDKGAFTASFLRTTLTLLSLVLLGIPIVFNLPAILSDTRVVRYEKPIRKNPNTSTGPSIPS